MIKSLGHVENPVSVLQQTPGQNHARTTTPALLHFRFKHRQYYLDNQQIELSALCLLNSGRVLCTLFESTRPEDASIDQRIALAMSQNRSDPVALFEDLLEQHQLNVVALNEPWRLETCRIDKPWGAEVWYTGIEKRGVCSVNGFPLPWLFELAPLQVQAEAGPSTPLLLKILDPLADETLGDLYFELHEEKIEVYIVTHVDRTVWHNGVGQIRYGFSQQKLRQFESDKAFKTAYLAAVTAYRRTREEIDLYFDRLRSKEKIAANTPLTAGQHHQWLEQLPDQLKQQELSQREEMYSFTHLRNIAVGDVIRVEPYFPHSLQHGVRVIEFQTAHYERHILSFAQKVLTQKHWDTEAALEHVITKPAPTDTLKILLATADYQLEEIADFGVFKTQRLRLNPRSSFSLMSEDYCLLIGIQGEAFISGFLSGAEGKLSVSAEVAYLIPAVFLDAKLDTRAGSLTGLLIETRDQPATLLFASP